MKQSGSKVITFRPTLTQAAVFLHLFTKQPELQKRIHYPIQNKCKKTKEHQYKTAFYVTVQSLHFSIDYTLILIWKKIN